MDYNIIGADVSKAKLDIWCLPDNKFIQITNDTEGFKQIDKILKKKTTKIIMEATGCYHKKFELFLVDRGYEVYVLNPKWVKNFGGSKGKLAKNDKLDAQTLAQYGLRMDLPNKSTLDHDRQRFKELVSRREQMIVSMKIEKSRLDKSDDKLICDTVRQAVAYYQKLIKIINDEIKQVIDNNVKYRKLFDEMIMVKGVGFATAIMMLANLPELGEANKLQIAKLVGVAPMDCESGEMRWRKCIKGGRKNVRNALYMAVVSAIRCNEVIKIYYKGLRNRGKPAKAAITACMRKLLLHLNSLAANLV